jgi:hypothetical protein
VFGLEGFLSGDIVVNCQTEEETIEFFRWCREEHGITWFGGDELDENKTHRDWGSQTTHRLTGGIDGGLKRGTVDYYIEEGKTVLCFRDFIESLNSDDFELASDEEFEAFLT